MKKDNEEWIDVLKEKVGAYSGDKPATDWSELHARMVAAEAGKAVAPAGRKVTRRFWTAAAAACLAALVAGGLFLSRNAQDDAAEVAERVIGAEQAESPVTARENEITIAESLPQDEAAKLLAEQSAIALNSSLQDKGNVAKSLLSSENNAGTQADESGNPAAVGTQAAESKAPAVPQEPDNSQPAEADKSAGPVQAASAPQSPAVQAGHTGGRTGHPTISQPANRHKSGKFSIGLSGQLANGSEPTPNHPAPSRSTIETSGEFKVMSLSRAVASTEYHYAAPVSFGLELRYHTPWNVFLESGVRLTRYLTVVTPSGVRQALLYAGIPVEIGCDIFSKDNLGLYASGFYMPSKCIGGIESANYPTNSTNRRDIPLQHSVGLNAGADYTVWRNLSIYAEPSLSYCFKDEAAPVTIFTEHPLYFTLNIGARFNF